MGINLWELMFYSIHPPPPSIIPLFYQVLPGIGFEQHLRLCMEMPPIRADVLHVFYAHCTAKRTRFSSFCFLKRYTSGAFIELYSENLTLT